MTRKPPPFSALLGQSVVVDTRAGNPLFLGTLDRIEERSLFLRDADVHDATESRTPREVYIMESRKFGVKANRREVEIRLDEVISVSRLEDVITY